MEAFRWRGETADRASVFAAMSKSGRLETSEGRSFDVPTRSDYEAALHAAGLLGETGTLSSSPELAAAAQADWHSRGHNACEFAVFLSDRRAEFGWETYVLFDSGDGRADAEAVDAVVWPRVEAPEADIASVLLPHVESSERLAELVWHLGQMPHWRLRDEGTEDDPELGQIVRLGLDLDVGLDHWSEVLGFGPFAALARTRGAPVCELAIRMKPPPRPDKERRANMDDIEVPLKGSEFGEAWRRTRANRAERLGPEHDKRGKARITFVVDADVWLRGAT